MNLSLTILIFYISLKSPVQTEEIHVRLAIRNVEKPIRVFDAGLD